MADAETINRVRKATALLNYFEQFKWTPDTVEFLAENADAEQWIPVIGQIAVHCGIKMPSALTLKCAATMLRERQRTDDPFAGLPS